MCVIFFYVNSNPGPGEYKLILASNRDEFYARDTHSVCRWEKAPHCFGGIDLEPGREGGTWLAIGGQNGILKVGALLNLTGEPKPKNAVGRGMIVSDFVTSPADCTIESYNSQLVADCTKYSAFNFVSIQIGDCSTPALISLLSNVPPGVEHYEERKCYGFGNSLPAVPFQKVLHGRTRFEGIVEKHLASAKGGTCEGRDELVHNLMDLLKCKQKFWPDAELKRRAPNWGEHLSALNVDIPKTGYGSRTHSVILIDGNNKMDFFEETMNDLNPEGSWGKAHIEEEFLK